jgi:hypothetical protein
MFFGFSGYYFHLLVDRLGFEVFMAITFNEILWGDQPCKYGDGVRRFGDYLRLHQHRLIS